VIAATRSYGYANRDQRRDFETTNQLFGRLDYYPKSYQENRRTSFLIEGIRLEIDHWPLSPVPGNRSRHLRTLMTLSGIPR
jgi:adenylate cyclase class 2